MKTLLMFLACVSSFGVCASALGAQDDLEGYYEVTPVSLPDSLSESYAGGVFRLSVLRIADSERDRGLLRRAESLFPPQESIEAARADYLRTRGGRGRTTQMEEIASMVGPRWWWNSFDETLTPYALTGPAVAYYLERLRDLAAGPNPLAEYTGTTWHSGRVDYRASVECRGDPGPCVVEMQLAWGYTCGSLCAIHFTEERSVTFDASGEVISVEGDGPARYGVS